MSQTKLHVPECQDSSCKQHLENLQKELSNNGCSVAKYSMSGRYSTQFNTLFEICTYTVLHKCTSLWKRLSLKDKGMDSYMLQDSNKIICVDFKKQTDSPSNAELHNCQPYEEFFADLMVHDASDEIKLAKFVIDLKSTICNGSEPKDYSSCTRRRSSDIYSIPYPNLSDTDDFGDQQVLAMLHVMREEECNQAVQSMGQLLPFPDRSGSVHSVQAKLVDETSPAEVHIQYNQLSSFSELKNLINYVLKNPLKYLTNLNFLLHKVLPEMYSRFKTVGIMTLATCDDLELQKHALDVLELLLLEGRLAEQPIDWATMIKTQEMLFESICLMSSEGPATKSLANTKATLQRKCTLLYMLRGESIMACKEPRDLENMEKFNSKLKRLAKSKYEETTSNKYMDEILIFLDASPTDVRKIIHSILSKLSTDKPSDVVLEMQGKKEPFQFFIVSQLLKKIFSGRDLQSLEILKAYFAKPKGNKLFSRPSIYTAPSCYPLILRQLTQVLKSLSKDCAYRDLPRLCEDVKMVIISCKKKDPKTFDDLMATLQTLMFRQTPSVRNCVVELFKAEGIYHKSFVPHLIQAVRSLLFPVLVLDQGAVTAKSPEQDCDGWVKISGKFGVHPVSVFIHEPTDEDHRQTNTTQFVDLNNAMRLKQIDMLRILRHENIITLFAFNTSHIPNFYVIEVCTVEGNENLQEYLVHRYINRTFLSQATLLTMLMQAASAMEFCHSKNIIHRNLTAASFLVAGKTKVKLTGFHLSTALGSDFDEIHMESTDHPSNSMIPTRWSAPESLRRNKWSKMSDVWMFGPLTYELFTHGGLPYSHVAIHDAELTLKIVKGSVQLKQESCISDQLFHVILKCGSLDPLERPQMSKLRKIFAELAKKADQDEFGNRPVQQEETRKPSTKFQKGIPKVKYDYFRNQEPKSCTRPQATMRVSKIEGEHLIKEYADREFPGDLLDRINTGALDHLLPFIHINIEQKTVIMMGVYQFLVHVNAPCIGGNVISYSKECGFVEIQLPCSNIWNLFQVISIMEDGEIQSLLCKIAVMIQRMHKSNFIFGELRASQIYVDSTCVGKMRVFPVSLAYLNCVPEKRRQVQFTVPNDPVSLARSAHEVNQQGIYSCASDVYSFAVLVLELYETKYHVEQQAVPNADIVQEGKINPDNVKKPKKMPKRSFDVMKKCLAPTASSRPSIAEIICVLSSDKTCPTDFLSSDSSSDVYPNDNDTTESSETICTRKRKVKRTIPQWSPFVSQKLTRSLSSGVINPSQSESSENDQENLYEHDTRKALSTEFKAARNHTGWRYQVKSYEHSSDSLPTRAARRNVHVRLDTSCTQAKAGAWGHSYFQDSVMNPSTNDEYDDVAPKTPPVILRSKKPLHRTPALFVQSQAAAAGSREGRYNRDSYLHVTNSDTEGEDANNHGNTLHEKRLMQFENVYDLISASDRMDDENVYLEPFKLR